MTSYSNQEKQKIIFEAYSSNKYFNENLNITESSVSDHSAVCVDDIVINFSFENDILKSAEYKGVGCSIFKSSIVLMLDMFINKSKEEINSILDTYFNVINKSESTEEEEIKLEKLVVFKNVKVHLNRLECASIMYRAVKKGING